MKYIKSISEFLAESYADEYPKNKFIKLGMDDVKLFRDDLLKIITNAYADKGGHFEIKKPSDFDKTDLNFWISNDIDRDPEIDITISGKTTNHGVKLTIMGQDGSKESKKEAIIKLKNLLSTKGFYAEFDKDLAQKLGLPFIKDEREIRSVLNKKLKMNPDGSYDRKISNKNKTKVLVGVPK